MKTLFIKISNRHENIFKFLVAVASIAIIVLALPRQVQFNYEVERGKPWAYDNLAAPFDLPIYKTEAQLNDERNAIITSQHPYFNFDSTIETKQLNYFENSFLHHTLDHYEYSGTDSDFVKSNTMFRLQRDLGDEVLHTVFSAGIIQSLEQPSNDKTDSIINTISNNILTEKEIKSFFTIQSAYDFMADAVEKKFGKGNNDLMQALEQSILPNVLYDEVLTKRWNKQALEKISLTFGKIQQGENIVMKGELVDENRFQKIESLKRELQNQELNGNSHKLLVAGHAIIVTLAFSMLLTFLGLFRKEFFADNMRVLFLLLMVVSMVLIFLWVRKLADISSYIVPICILPIVVRTFYDTRTALFTLLCTLLIIGFAAPNGFEFMFIQTITGMAAIFSSTKLRNRSQFFFSALIIFITYSVSFIGVSMLHEGSWKELDWNNLKWFFGNAAITLFSFPLIFLFEKVFGFLSDVSLMELADSNSKVLRELAFKAPGTFQHSLQVANLAEAAIFEIGGNTLLVRTGALYHDLGKIEMPEYFIENQTTRANPHDELPFEESAAIIKSHVIKGIEKARRHKVPDQVIDFIRTHHGTSRLQYFYQSFLKSFPQEPIEEERFRYTGPVPFSKETVVVMMADSVEAASRSLKSPDEDNIDKLVESIITNQMEQGQYINSPITLKEIARVKFIFKKMLRSMYHVRKSYPQ